MNVHGSRRTLFSGLIAASRMSFCGVVFVAWFSGCSREDQSANTKVNPAPTTIASAHKIKNTADMGANGPANDLGAVDFPPSQFRFVGEMWVGKAGYFAIQDTGQKTTAWYRPHDRI